jgi:SAM-dependent methyltransferase
MPSRAADYGDIAPIFDQRYEADALEGVAQALVELAGALEARSILEVGCGTGRWLAEFASGARAPFGLDYSSPMLKEGRRRDRSFRLMRGRASQLPLRSASFDLVFCVNAIHQFEWQRDFVREARRLLRPGGALAVVGMDPRSPRHIWYIHDYFETTLMSDLERFPTLADLTDWAEEANFSSVERTELEPIQDRKVGREVLDAQFLRKDSCSQLANLSQMAYQDGLRRIESALAAAEEAGQEISFVTDLRLEMVVCRVGKED